MVLTHITLKNVRSLALFQSDFSDKINLLYGGNGKGKTTILEAVYLLSMSKSFRSGARQNIVKAGEKSLAVEGIVVGEDQQERPLTYYRRGEEKRIKYDGQPIKRGIDLIGLFPVVVMSPEDEDIISGPAANRRNYLNRIFSVVDREYLTALKEYEKIRKQRNILLQYGDIRQLDAWSENIAGAGIRLWGLRKQHINGLKSRFNDIWRSIFPEITAEVRFLTKACETRGDYMRELSTVKEDEILRRRTLFGPHRDDLRFYFENMDLRQFGSQGEKKIFLAALKKTEAIMIKDRLKKSPVILLDDLFAKLDAERGRRMFSLFENTGQIFITSTDQNITGIKAGRSESDRLISIGLEVGVS